MSDRRPLVAVIDDDASVVRALPRLLGAYGYRVRPFTSTQQFVDEWTLDDGGFHCLVVDVHMPGVSGLELPAALRADNRRFPIVFVTGAADATVRSRALAEGGALLEKPVGHVELLQAIEQAVSCGALSEVAAAPLPRE